VTKQRTAEDEAARVQGELDQAKREISDLEQRNTAATNKTADLQNVINAAQKMYNIDLNRFMGTPEPIDAVVQDVNDDIGFVILSVGSQDNVKTGNKFDVFRGSTYVGEWWWWTRPIPTIARPEIVLRNAQFKKNDSRNHEAGQLIVATAIANVFKFRDHSSWQSAKCSRSKRSSEPQVETEARAGLTFEIGLVLATTITLVIGLVLGWMELQKFAEM
jgi:hypothetical protein